MSSYFDIDIFGTNVNSLALCKQRNGIWQEGKGRDVKNKKQNLSEEQKQKLSNMYESLLSLETGLLHIQVQRRGLGVISPPENHND